MLMALQWRRSSARSRTVFLSSSFCAMKSTSNDRFRQENETNREKIINEQNHQFIFECSHCRRPQTLSFRIFSEPQQRKEAKSSSLENNVSGFVDRCVRSSLDEISTLEKKPNVTSGVEVEIEYDPLLGNVRATRKRSTTLTSRTDHQREKTPIWARQATSHSMVKPSDLVREFDRKDKLEPNALRRLSRSELTNENRSQSPSVIKETILRWCQEITQFYKGVNIRNFSSSWNDGLAFCAIVHRYFPEEFNFDTLSANEPRRNFDLAFAVAQERASIEPLIDTDDMISMGDRPDWKVVFTYVQSLYRHLSRFEPPAVLRERW